MFSAKMSTVASEPGATFMELLLEDATQRENCLCRGVSTLQTVRNKKMSEDSNVQEKCSWCCVPADLVHTQIHLIQLGGHSRRHHTSRMKTFHVFLLLLFFFYAGVHGYRSGTGWSSYHPAEGYEPPFKAAASSKWVKYQLGVNCPFKTRTTATRLPHTGVRRCSGPNPDRFQLPKHT